MLERGNIDVGLFVLTAPRLNHTIQAMGEIYADKLNTPQVGRTGFLPLSIERLLEALIAIGMVSHAPALYRRYLDFHLVDGELDLDAAQARSPKKPRTKPAPLQGQAAISAT